MERFENIGIIKNKPVFDEKKLQLFETTIKQYRKQGHWTKQQIIDLFEELLPDFHHKEMGKYLDDKM